MSQDGGLIRPVNIVEKIRTTHDGGHMFKVDFLVLLVTTLIGGTKCGSVNQRFIFSITADCDVKNLDWCGYLLQAIRTCKDEWIPNSRNYFFIGPVTFVVLLYCDSVACDVPIILRTRPAIYLWTTDHIKARQQFEVSNGGFGRLPLNDAWVSSQAAEDEFNRRNDPSLTEDILSKTYSVTSPRLVLRMKNVRYKRIQTWGV